MKKERCTRCGRELCNKKIVWLELSNTNGLYYWEIPKSHISQGGFPFGAACSRTERRETRKHEKGLNN